MPRTSSSHSLLRRSARHLLIAGLVGAAVLLFLIGNEVSSSGQVQHVITLTPDQLAGTDTEGRLIINVPVDQDRRSAPLTVSSNPSIGTTVMYWERLDTHAVNAERFESANSMIVNLLGFSLLGGATLLVLFRRRQP